MHRQRATTFCSSDREFLAAHGARERRIGTVASTDPGSRPIACPWTQRATGVGVVVGVAGSVIAGFVAARRRLAKSRTRDRRPPQSARRRSLEVPAVRDRDDLVDPETGLLDGRYFAVALEQRVAASRRKLQPLAVMLVDIDTVADSALDFVEQAAVVHETLREADTICRIGTNRLGLILEEATEFGAVFAIERIRMAVNHAGGDEEHLWAGVAGYPSHALRRAAAAAPGGECARACPQLGSGLGSRRPQRIAAAPGTATRRRSSKPRHT